MNDNFLLPGERATGHFHVLDNLGDIPQKYVEYSAIYLGDVGLIVLTVLAATLIIDRLFK